MQSIETTQMPIPYGLLVGTGTVPFSRQFNRKDVDAQFITQEIADVREDWVSLLERAHADRHSCLWTLHPALYRLADGIRFLHVGQNDEIRVLHGSEEILDAIVSQQGVFSFTCFEAYLEHATKLSPVDARKLADGLVEQGFLVPSTTKSETEGLAEGGRGALAKVLAPHSLSVPWESAERVQSAVSCLASIFRPPSDTLKDLKRVFAERWQDRSVPLMVMFDPDVGVDTDGLPSRQLGDLVRAYELVASEPRAHEPERRDFGWTAKKLEGMKVLDLSDLANTDDWHLDAHLPSSLAAIFQIDGGKGNSVWLQTAAGQGATRMLTRAALQDPAALALLSEVAEWDMHRESALHVELFVAPSIQDVPTVGRVNPFEGVLAICGAPTDSAVPLSAVEVRLCEDEFVLVDSRTGMSLEVHHSDPLRLDAPERAPHIRFLARMAARPAFWSLQWKWLPHEEAAHLPRVVHKGSVLHPESWRLQWSEVRNLSHASVRELLQARGVPEMTLAKPKGLPAQVISQRHTGSLQDLIRILRQVGVVYLQECCPNSVLELGSGRHVCEFVLPLQRIYPRRLGKSAIDVFTTPAEVAPPNQAVRAMSGWLSFEIGTYESRADLLILDVVLPLVRHLIASGMATQWHYTRGDTAMGAIVNLRLLVVNEIDVVASTVHEYLNENGKQLVRDCSSTRFIGESDRYGGGDTYIEILRHFELQSWDCAAWLDTNPCPDETARVLRHALVCASIFRETYAPNAALDACKILASKVAPEWISSATAKNIASSLLRENRNYIEDISINEYDNNNILVESIATIYKKGLQNDILISSIHMYGNRLFRHSQRDHEHISYLIAEKIILSRDMRARN